MSKQEQSHICRRCGRKLRTPEAKERGMGVVCYQKWLSEKGTRKLFKISSLQSSNNSL